MDTETQTHRGERHEKMRERFSDEPTSQAMSKTASKNQKLGET